jgi:hypothetical protein
MGRAVPVQDDWDERGGDSDATTSNSRDAERARLVPMKVGNSEVWVESVGPPPEVELDAADEWEAIGGLDPADAFYKASDALRECVHIVGEKLDDLGDKISPDEVGVEFTISFDVGGEARIIPVLLTTKANTTMGVKVTALWRPNGNGRDAQERKDAQ